MTKKIIARPLGQAITDAYRARARIYNIVCGLLLIFQKDGYSKSTTVIPAPPNCTCSSRTCFTCATVRR